MYCDRHYTTNCTLCCKLHTTDCTTLYSVLYIHHWTMLLKNMCCTLHTAEHYTFYTVSYFYSRRPNSTCFLACYILKTANCGLCYRFQTTSVYIYFWGIYQKLEQPESGALVHDNQSSSVCLFN